MALAMRRHIATSGGGEDPPPDPPGVGNPTYISDPTAVYQMPTIQMPEWRGWFTDPVFQPTITRISDLSQAAPAATGAFGIIYEYPIAVPISKNKTWITLFTRSNSGSGWGAVYRMSDGVRVSAPISPGSGMETGFHWSPTDDNVGWFQSNRWQCRMDMPSATVTQLYRPTRADGSQYSFFDRRGNGNLSYDNVWQCGEGYNYPAGTTVKEWLMYDRRDNSLYKRITAPPQNAYTSGLNITPYSGMAVAGGDAATWDTNLYDHDFNFVRRIHRVASHGTLAMGTDGEEYYIYPAQTAGQISEQGWGGMTKVRISDGARARILGFDGCPNSAIHVSGVISYSHPGWFVMSHYSTVFPVPFTRVGEHEVWLWNFETGAVKRIAHTHNKPIVTTSGLGKDYWAETQATSSWDGNAILFKSNWMTEPPNTQVLTYMATGTFW